MSRGSQLRLGDDGGGWRQYLNGEPISCGTLLELEEHSYTITRGGNEEFAPTGNWIPVRYEVAWRTDPRTSRTIRVPMMHKRVGGYEFTCPIEDHHKFRWPRGDS